MILPSPLYILFQDEFESERGINLGDPSRSGRSHTNKRFHQKQNICKKHMSYTIFFCDTATSRDIVLSGVRLTFLGDFPIKKYVHNFLESIVHTNSIDHKSKGNPPLSPCITLPMLGIFSL